MTPCQAYLGSLPKTVLPPGSVTITQPQPQQHCHTASSRHPATHNVDTMASYTSETIKLLGSSIRPESFKPEAERFEAKEAARRLLARLETPFERG